MFLNLRIGDYKNKVTQYLFAMELLAVTIKLQNFLKKNIHVASSLSLQLYSMLLLIISVLGTCANKIYLHYFFCNLWVYHVCLLGLSRVLKPRPWHNLQCITKQSKLHDISITVLETVFVFIKETGWLTNYS